MYKEVFISHAKEDYKVAEELYEHLTQIGYLPWLDKKNIKVGQNWDYEIKKALKESTFVVLLLSSTSVRKRGYVQKEFKYAVEYSETKLIDDIYIIPILIDNCEIPEHLNKFQWISFNNKNLMEEITNSLNLQRKKYLSSLSSDLVKISDYTSLSIDLNIDIPSKIDYSCDLPLFYENNFFDSSFVNTFIQQKALEVISEHRKYIDDEDEFFSEGKDDWFYLDISHTINILNKNILSLSIYYNTFFGGAHPSTYVDTLNFAFNPERILRLYDFVKLSDIKEFITNCLSRYGDEEQKECLYDYIEYITDENVNFTFNGEFLEIDFTNEIPRVILALGILEIPTKDLTLLVNLE